MASVSDMLDTNERQILRDKVKGLEKKLIGETAGQGGMR